MKVHTLISLLIIGGSSSPVLGQTHSNSKTTLLEGNKTNPVTCTEMFNDLFSDAAKDLDIDRGMHKDCQC